MKYLLTESRLQNLIEIYIRENFSDLNIISVSFRKQNVTLASDGGRSITRNVIVIVIDPFNRGSGNLEERHKAYNYGIRREIFNSIDNMFSLKMSEYGSEWELEVYGLKIVEVN